MKNKENRYFQNGINGLLIVCGGILFYYILFHSDNLSSLVKSGFRTMTPFIAGCSIAYILNPIMVFIEDRIIINIIDKISNKKEIIKLTEKSKKVIRVISTFITIIIFLMILYGLVMLVVPRMITNIQSIIDRVPTYFFNLSKYFNDLLKQYPNLDDLLKNYWSDIYNWVYSTVVPQLENAISKVSTTLLGSIITIFKSLLNFVIGIIIAIYLLIDKEKFLAQGKKILYAFLKEEKANNFINNLRYTDKILGGFLTGKVVDSLIVGSLCYILMNMLKLPFPPLISVIIGVTNVIPYFGPFIGAIPSAILVLLVSPKKCLIFIIFIIILQQFDGNVLGAKILGDSTGLSSFWVIFAITITGGTLGLLGMFIGVPLFAVFYSAVRTLVNERLARKKMPVETNYYKKSDYSRKSVNTDGSSFRFNKNAFDNVRPDDDLDNMIEDYSEYDNKEILNKDIIEEK